MNWRDELTHMYLNDPHVHAVLELHRVTPTTTAYTLGPEILQDIIRVLFDEKTRLAKELETHLLKTLPIVVSSEQDTLGTTTNRIDPDLSPDNVMNVEAARKLGLRYDRQSRVYRDSDGCVRRDKFGQPL